MHRLLFEIGTEELPPSEMANVLPALVTNAGKLLDDARLGYRDIRSFTTPRRLAVTVDGLEERQPSRTTTVTGPPKKAAFDAQGKPTKAAEGFARSNGVTVDRLTTVATERGEYLAFERHEAGEPASVVLPAVLERLAFSLPFSKQMRWGAGDVRYTRPIRWVVALLDTVVLPLALAGVEAGRLTRGHRFLAPAAITLEGADAGAYASALEQAFVIADLGTRRERIAGQLVSAFADPAYRVDVDPKTLEIVVHLVECPATIVGQFPKEYLDLPREVVETPIRHHQKSFTVVTNDGTLAPYFVSVSNMPGCDPTEIRRGNERVIRARLADADFYFREDLKTTPEDRVRRLEGMVFQERLGSLREKTDRLIGLVEYLATRAPGTRANVLHRAALLSKSDLASGMVREFPELEGIMGGEYAMRAGESAPVAHAIREHYLPRSADGALPESPEGAVLGVADKIDTIVGCIGVGLLPTGSQDPYALRRQAQGVVQIAITRRDEIGLSLAGVVDRALDLLADKLTEPRDVTRQRVLEFFRPRLVAILTAHGARLDVVDAVLSSGFDEPCDVVKRVDALTTLMGRDDWDPLVVTFKRAINILPAGFDAGVDPSRFVHDAERRLHEAIAQRGASVRAALEAGRYTVALSEIAALRAPVDAFFEAVLVMDKDPTVRNNRLALLKVLANWLLPVADLRKIQASLSA